MNINTCFNDIFGKSNYKKISAFYCYKENDFKKKIEQLYEKYLELKGDYEFDNDIYSEAIKEIVCSCTSNKDTLINAYKRYNEYLTSKYNIDINIVYPPIPVSNTFERLMFISKYFQNPNNKVDSLQDVLWVSKRTIEGDIAKLCGNDDDPLQVCGNEFIVNEISRSMGSIEFESTVHPFFLTCNLTQVIVMLEGLKMMAEKPEYKGYALPTARNIWQQLSDYGKERIQYVAENLLHKDISWYYDLTPHENEDGILVYKEAFSSERECSALGDDTLIDCLKNGDKRTCFIEYKDGESTILLENVKLIGGNGEEWEAVVDGEKVTLERERIIRSSYHKENMY